MKAILILITLLTTTQSFALSQIFDVKKSANRIEVIWGTCSPYPVLMPIAKPINEKDIAVQFITDNVQLCVHGGIEALNEEISTFFSIENLFRSAGIEQVEDSIGYISWN